MVKTKLKNENDIFLEQTISEDFICFLNDNFYQKVVDKSKIENLFDDADFWKDPTKHLALYADHSIHHIKDVAMQGLEVLNNIHGLLIPLRSQERLVMMKGYLLLLTYLHDIGMVNYSPIGRSIHAEFAGQYVFSKEFQEQFTKLWKTNCAGIPWHLLNLHIEGSLSQDPQVVFREMLSFSCWHSRSFSTLEPLGDASEFRKKMIDILFKNLNEIYFEKQLKRRNINPDEKNAILQKLKDINNKDSLPLDCSIDDIVNFYGGNPENTMPWLINPVGKMADLFMDIGDVLRVLRCADSLRLRGIGYRTSAGYEILTDVNTGKAVYAIRTENQEKLIHLEIDNPINAAESNISSSALSADGNLWVAFNRGFFFNQEEVPRSAHDAAKLICSLQEDVVSSFARPENENFSSMLAPPKMPSSEMKVMIESIDDFPLFSKMVIDYLQEISPELIHSYHLAPSFHDSKPTEIEWYFSGEKIVLDDQAKKEYTTHLKAYGHTLRYKLEELLEECRLVHMPGHTVLIQEGGLSGFVYLPLEDGVEIRPFGLSNFIKAKKWVPVGDTGVIRGGMRNATVLATKDMSLIMIPKHVYLTKWYDPFHVNEMEKIFKILKE